MIRMGLNQTNKQKVLDKYMTEHKIRKVFILYFKKFKPVFDIPIDHEYVEYSDIEMYKYFYRLLQEIGNDCLVVVDECMRTRNRSELIYNCAHHYLNQTEHKIIFEYFPFIENMDDFMILLDFLNKGKYKGKGFDWQFIKDEDIQAKRHEIDFTVEQIKMTDEIVKAYLKKKEQLFDNLGNKDPDTLPRDLHVYAGNFKKPYIKGDKQYIARNARYNLPNVATYQNPIKADYILDFHYRRLDFNDYLKTFDIHDVTFISSGLPVDDYYEGEFKAWINRLGEFYAKASVYQ